ncbi:MAG: long-chain fatty acid--CoA ligase [Bacteroidetes bacterium 43-16]|nr:MAG: long-chain fatty acid--CoA ligase [Bacteroidetes bacterium 43-16]
MEQYSRLFDCLSIESIIQKPALLSSKVKGSYKDLSTQDVIRDTNALTNGLIQLGIMVKEGIENQDKIGLISNSRPEWLITDFAVQQAGAILVPLYPNTNIEDIIFVFNEAEVKYCFVNDRKTYLNLLSVQAQIPSLKQVYCFTEAEGVVSWQSVQSTPDATQLDEIERRKALVKEEDVATIIYTSGTTGKPKGVMLSHKNIMSNVKNLMEVIDGIGIKDKKCLSFLPLNHIFEKTITYIYLYNGFTIYYAEGMETIAENLREVKPALFVTVPRLLERVYEKIMTTGSELKGIKRKMFFWAVDVANQFKLDSINPVYNVKLAIANKLVFSKWRAALGGNVHAIVVGGAACPPKLAKLFTAAQIPIMEGYGLTESSPVITVNRFDKKDRRIGTIGPAIKNVAVKIAEDGELLCKGENVMVGYYKNPEETAQVIVDGWLHTGDIGTVVEGRFYKITDRKKELFKNSGGKYIAPQPIENLLRGSRFIEQVMVVGANEKYVGALIVPNFENLKKWMLLNGLPFTSIADTIKHPGVLKQYKSIIDGFNKELSAIEGIKKFKLLPKEFTVESGELTPKLSMKRKVILEHFSKEIKEIFTK